MHIAGTNGKGSLAAMTAAILTAAGYKTGLTISPYVVEFRERFQIDGQMIPPRTLASLTQKYWMQWKPSGRRVGNHRYNSRQ